MGTCLKEIMWLLRTAIKFFLSLYCIILGLDVVSCSYVNQCWDQVKITWLSALRNACSWKKEKSKRKVNHRNSLTGLIACPSRHPTSMRLGRGTWMIITIMIKFWPISTSFHLQDHHKTTQPRSWSPTNTLP